jgi:hypothetical protein
VLIGGLLSKNVNRSTSVNERRREDIRRKIISIYRNKRLVWEQIDTRKQGDERSSISNLRPKKLGRVEGCTAATVYRPRTGHCRWYLER